MTGGEVAIEPLVSLSMPIGAFAADWRHCDAVATYVARLVSISRSDPLLYSNLFSSAFNELLETAFRFHGGDQPIGCVVSRVGSKDRVELAIPCDEAAAEYYRTAATLVTGEGVSDRYMKALLADTQGAAYVGLYELTIDYRAAIDIRETSDSRTLLVVDLELETLGAN